VTIKTFKSLYSVLAVVVMIMAFNSVAYAQGDLMPASGSTQLMSDTTHPPLQLTPNKSELVRLERNAGSVIVGNPAHVDVLLESTKLLVVVPQAPGTTFLTVLDEAGNTLMQRHLIIASPKKNYIRIRRSCMVGSETSEDCEQTSVYYCEGMCHQIATPSMEQAVASDTISNALDTLNKEINKLQDNE
jgi:hypothetical protein